VPDQRFILAPIRTPIRTCTRFTLAIAGTAIALVTAASGAEVAFPASAAAQTASTGQTAGTGQAASPAGAARASGQSGAAVLDGSAQPLTLAGHRRHLRPRQIAWRMLRRKGWSPDYQYPFLNRLWKRESGWNVHAENPYSGAYGIPQAVPGSKMASAGPNWPNSARTQIRWGLRYIRARYNSPRRAWLHSRSYGWY
jgi:hypothetical protein